MSENRCLHGVFADALLNQFNIELQPNDWTLVVISCTLLLITRE